MKITAKENDANDIFADVSVLLAHQISSYKIWTPTLYPWDEKADTIFFVFLEKAFDKALV